MNFIYNKFINKWWRWFDIKIWPNKSLEWQLELSDCSWVQHPQWKYFAGNRFIGTKLHWSKKQDHAGIFLEFGILGLFWFEINIHDHRHWDYENNCWKKYE